MTEKRWLTKAAKLALNPFADIYASIDEKMLELSDLKLARLLAACGECTTVNCSYAHYRVAQMLIPGIKSELDRRKRARLP